MPWGFGSRGAFTPPAPGARPQVPLALALRHSCSGPPRVTQKAADVLPARPGARRPGQVRLGAAGCSPSRAWVTGAWLSGQLGVCGASPQASSPSGTLPAPGPGRRWRGWRVGRSWVTVYSARRRQPQCHWPLVGAREVAVGEAEAQLHSAPCWKRWSPTPRDGAGGLDAQGQGPRRGRGGGWAWVPASPGSRSTAPVKP